jgi:hypothetical protein
MKIPKLSDAVVAAVYDHRRIKNHTASSGVFKVARALRARGRRTECDGYQLHGGHRPPLHRKLCFVAAMALLAAALIPADGQPAGVALPPAPSSPASPASPDTASVLPAAGFSADRYAVLWTKSPFAVATSETTGEESPDYYLVGVANQDGIFYASVIERQNSEHFLLSSDKPVRGLTLKSIKRTSDGTSTFAEVMKDGQPLTLKLEQAPASATGMASLPGMGGTIPGMISPQTNLPGYNGTPPVRPFTRFHHPPIHLPPMPQPAAPPPQPQAAPAPPPP